MDYAIEKILQFVNDHVTSQTRCENFSSSIYHMFWAYAKTGNIARFTIHIRVYLQIVATKFSLKTARILVKKSDYFATMSVHGLRKRTLINVSRGFIAMIT